ncbi:MAG: hypothetical protein LBM02_03190, partial [Lachnospiraceae bacterium]|nr:hypothetical protein [Lachnospiraceae bacterium]
ITQNNFDYKNVIICGPPFSIADILKYTGISSSVEIRRGYTYNAISQGDIYKLTIEEDTKIIVKFDNEDNVLKYYATENINITINLPINESGNYDWMFTDGATSKNGVINSGQQICLATLLNNTPGINIVNMVDVQVTTGYEVTGYDNEGQPIYNYNKPIYSTIKAGSLILHGNSSGKYIMVNNLYGQFTSEGWTVSERQDSAQYSSNEEYFYWGAGAEIDITKNLDNNSYDISIYGDIHLNNVNNLTAPAPKDSGDGSGDKYNGPTFSGYVGSVRKESDGSYVYNGVTGTITKMSGSSLSREGLGSYLFTPGSNLKKGSVIASDGTRAKYDSRIKDDGSIDAYGAKWYERLRDGIVGFFSILAFSLMTIITLGATVWAADMPGMKWAREWAAKTYGYWNNVDANADNEDAVKAGQNLGLAGVAAIAVLAIAIAGVVSGLFTGEVTLGVAIAAIIGIIGAVAGAISVMKLTYTAITAFQAGKLGQGFLMLGLALLIGILTCVGGFNIGSIIANGLEKFGVQMVVKMLGGAFVGAFAGAAVTTAVHLIKAKIEKKRIEKELLKEMGKDIAIGALTGFFTGINFGVQIGGIVAKTAAQSAGRAVAQTAGNITENIAEAAVKLTTGQVIKQMVFGAGTRLSQAFTFVGNVGSMALNGYITYTASKSLLESAKNGDFMGVVTSLYTLVLINVVSPLMTAHTSVQGARNAAREDAKKVVEEAEDVVESETSTLSSEVDNAAGQIQGTAERVSIDVVERQISQSAEGVKGFLGSLKMGVASAFGFGTGNFQGRILARFWGMALVTTGLGVFMANLVAWLQNKKHASVKDMMIGLGVGFGLGLVVGGVFSAVKWDTIKHVFGFVKNEHGGWDFQAGKLARSFTPVIIGAGVGVGVAYLIAKIGGHSKPSIQETAISIMLGIVLGFVIGGLGTVEDAKAVGTATQESLKSTLGPMLGFSKNSLGQYVFSISTLAKTWGITFIGAGIGAGIGALVVFVLNLSEGKNDKDSNIATGVFIGMAAGAVFGVGFANALVAGAYNGFKVNFLTSLKSLPQNTLNMVINMSLISARMPFAIAVVDRIYYLISGGKSLADISFFKVLDTLTGLDLFKNASLLSTSGFSSESINETFSKSFETFTSTQMWVFGAVVGLLQPIIGAALVYSPGIGTIMQPLNAFGELSFMHGETLQYFYEEGFKEQMISVVGSILFGNSQAGEVFQELFDSSPYTTTDKLNDLNFLESSRFDISEMDNLCSELSRIHDQKAFRDRLLLYLKKQGIMEQNIPLINVVNSENVFNEEESEREHAGYQATFSTNMARYEIRRTLLREISIMIARKEGYISYVDVDSINSMRDELDNVVLPSQLRGLSSKHSLLASFNFLYANACILALNDNTPVTGITKDMVITIMNRADAIKPGSGIDLILNYATGIAQARNWYSGLTTLENSIILGNLMLGISQYYSEIEQKHGQDRYNLANLETWINNLKLRLANNLKEIDNLKLEIDKHERQIANLDYELAGHQPQFNEDGIDSMIYDLDAELARGIEIKDELSVNLGKALAVNRQLSTDLSDAQVLKMSTSAAALVKYNYMRLLFDNANVPDSLELQDVAVQQPEPQVNRLSSMLDDIESPGDFDATERQNLRRTIRTESSVLDETDEDDILQAPDIREDLSIPLQRRASGSDVPILEEVDESESLQSSSVKHDRLFQSQNSNSPRSTLEDMFTRTQNTLYASFIDKYSNTPALKDVRRIEELQLLQTKTPDEQNELADLQLRYLPSKIQLNQYVNLLIDMTGNNKYFSVVEFKLLMNTDDFAYAAETDSATRKKLKSYRENLKRFIAQDTISTISSVRELVTRKVIDEKRANILIKDVMRVGITNTNVSVFPSEIKVLDYLEVSGNVQAILANIIASDRIFVQFEDGEMRFIDVKDKPVKAVKVVAKENDNQLRLNIELMDGTLINNVILRGNLAALSFNKDFYNKLWEAMWDILPMYMEIESVEDVMMMGYDQENIDKIKEILKDRKSVSEKGELTNEAREKIKNVLIIDKDNPTIEEKRNVEKIIRIVQKQRIIMTDFELHPLKLLKIFSGETNKYTHSDLFPSLVAGNKYEYDDSGERKTIEMSDFDLFVLLGNCIEVTNNKQKYLIQDLKKERKNDPTLSKLDIAKAQYDNYGIMYWMIDGRKVYLIREDARLINEQEIINAIKNPELNPNREGYCLNLMKNLVRYINIVKKSRTGEALDDMFKPFVEQTGYQTVAALLPRLELFNDRLEQNPEILSEFYGVNEMQGIVDYVRYFIEKNYDSKLKKFKPGTINRLRTELHDRSIIPNPATAVNILRLFMNQAMRLANGYGIRSSQSEMATTLQNDNNAALGMGGGKTVSLAIDAAVSRILLGDWANIEILVGNGDLANYVGEKSEARKFLECIGMKVVSINDFKSEGRDTDVAALSAAYSDPDTVIVMDPTIRGHLKNEATSKGGSHGNNLNKALDSVNRVIVDEVHLWALTRTASVIGGDERSPSDLIVNRAMEIGEVINIREIYEKMIGGVDENGQPNVKKKSAVVKILDKEVAVIRFNTIDEALKLSTMSKE